MKSVRRLRSLRPRGVGAVTLAVIVGAMIGLAGAAAKLVSGGEVHACAAKSTGAVTFISRNHRCQKGATSVLLSQKGPAGKPGKVGKVGKTGPIGKTGPAGPQGVAGPSGPADTEVVEGPSVTLSGGQPTGSTAISTAGCDHAVNGANREAYGGGVNVNTSPQTQEPDIVSVQSSYAGEGFTGNTVAAQPSSGQHANAWTAVAVINTLYNGSPADTATVQAYVVCGP